MTSCKKCKGRIDKQENSICNIPKDICADCYYNELGDIIEKHPIGIPGSHKGSKWIKK